MNGVDSLRSTAQNGKRKSVLRFEISPKKKQQQRTMICYITRSQGFYQSTLIYRAAGCAIAVVAALVGGTIFSKSK